MIARNAYEQYQQVEILTASPVKLVILCYEAALTALRSARKGLAADDKEKAHRGLIKAQDIISELMDALDDEKGGTIAQDLRSLYQYMLSRLMTANFKKDLEPVVEVEQMLGELLSAWRLAAQNL